MTTVTFVHLTDLHVSHPDLRDEQLNADTVGALDAIIERVNGIEPPPSFVAISGDLTNRGDVASYRLLRQKLEALEIPLVYALGNHDTRPGFYQGMLDRTDDGEAPYFHDTVIDGVHVVVLDTSVPGRIGGALCDAQFEFLEAALRRHPELPKIVVMHHAPSVGDDAGYAWERLDAADTARFLTLVKDRNVAGILTGHIHYDRVSVWHGIPVIVSNGNHSAVDPTYTNGLRIMAGTSFGFCALRPSGLTVSFVPMPSDRRELRRAPDERIRTYV